MSLAITGTLAHRLKHETAEAHAKTEEILSPKLSSIKNYDDYACILKMFYGFFFFLEDSVQSYIRANILPDIGERRNSKFILKDLEAISSSTKQLAICNAVPEIRSIAQALGALYVMEGSTLGGRMISKMLMKNTFVVFNDSNLNFFSGYKEQTGNRWKSFLTVVDKYEEDADEIIASANETFDCLTNWMKQSL